MVSVNCDRGHESIWMHKLTLEFLLSGLWASTGGVEVVADTTGQRQTDGER